MPSYVVVGASRGLGYEWLHNLSADKANVVIGLARTPAAVDHKLAKDEISNVHIVQADMIDHKSLVVAAGQVAELTKGSVDYLIVNGAYINYKTLGITPMAFMGNEYGLREEMKQYLDVNVIGVMFVINAFLPLIRQSAIKKITVLSSEMGDAGFVEKAKISSNVAYGASKAVLNMVVLKYSIELKNEGIIVLALSPGLINTMLEPPSREQLAGFLPIMKEFQNLYPNFRGPITAAESVALQKRVIEKVTITDSGESRSVYERASSLKDIR